MREKPLTTTKTSGSHFRKARWRVGLALNKREKEIALLLRQRVREVAQTATNRRRTLLTPGRRLCL